MLPRTQNLLLRLAKPLLRMHLELYRREVATAPYPLGVPDLVVSGPRPDRLAFVGDIAVAGYGVLHHGMTTSSQTAQRTAAVREQGCTWTQVSTPTLTVAGALRGKSLTPDGADAVVVVLGITDVLVGTSPAEWTCSLERLIDRVRHEAEPNTAVVLAGIPPMAEFRAMPPSAVRILTHLIDGLNDASRALAARSTLVSFVPFPAWDVGELFIQDALSWAQMHRLWAKALTPTVTQLLASRSDVVAFAG